MTEEEQLEKQEKILGLLNEESYSPMKLDQLAFFMEIPQTDYQVFIDIIESLIKKGKLMKTKKGKIVLAESLGFISGKFISNSKGFGFVELENKEYKDIFIPSSKVNGAMHKDLVLCKITVNSTKTKRAEAEIIQVLERGMQYIVGTFSRQKDFGFVIPDSDKISKDIYITRENSKNVVDGNKVVVKITKTPADKKNPEGKIVEILGHVDDPGVDVLSIIREHELPVEFPEDVLLQLENIPSEVLEEDIIGRKDLRDLPMVTIDGADSKDLDDAVSLSILDNGNYYLGVHIADVTHYVQEGSPLDKEAYNRGTSTYLVDRVIPMLPHLLSNGICSLNPAVNRLALSCFMEIDSSGNVVNHEIAKTVICTIKRMTYDMVAELLTDETSPNKAEHEDLMPMFMQMGQLASILRKKRIKRGAIEFNFAECKIKVDENCKPVAIVPYNRNVATSLIEEFMLACNETIAERFFWLESPFVFRSHEEPDPDKLLKLTEFVHNFGYTLKGGVNHPKSIQKLVAKVDGTQEEMVINKVILRSMKQARYTATNEGHFGLAAKYYCHFTSPIRRYPDLQIHRIIKESLDGISPSRIEHLNKIMPEVCKNCSINERRAEETEREVETMKKIEFMEDKVGQTFKGVISGVTSWGIYVEMENTVEGMIHVSEIDDKDYFEFDSAKLLFIGERSKKIYRLGDNVLVRIVKANKEAKELDLKFVKEK